MEKIQNFSDFITAHNAKVSVIKEENEKTEYAKKFVEKLKEFGVKSPNELNDEKKKEFFNSLKEEEVAKQPEAVVSIPAAKDDEDVQNKVEVVNTDGNVTAKKIEDEITTMGEPVKVEDDEELQNEVGEDDGTVQPTTESKLVRKIPTFEEFISSRK